MYLCVFHELSEALLEGSLAFIVREALRLARPCCALLCGSCACLLFVNRIFTDCLVHLYPRVQDTTRAHAVIRRHPGVHANDGRPFV
jgi:hypothetical protein